MVSIKNCGKDIDKIASLLEESFTEQGYDPKGTVFVKPNLSGRQPITEGENTTIYFMDALLKVLKKHHCKVIIGHSGLLGTGDRKYPFERVIKEAGFSKYKRVKDVVLLNLDEAKRAKHKSMGFDFEIPEQIMSSDSYINLAKLKTHMETVITFSLKNQMGILPEINRINMHKTDLERLIPHIALYAKPTLNILEAIVAMEGNGPHHGSDIELDKFFVSKNMVELDSVVSHLIDLNPREIPQLVEAEKIGIGKIPSEKELKEYADSKFKFKKANYFQKQGNKIIVWPTNSCSRCITALNESGKLMKSTPAGLLKLGIAGYFGKNKNIVIGTGKNIKLGDGDTLICVGLCAKKLADSSGVDCLVKCPPTVGETMDYLKKKL